MKQLTMFSPSQQMSICRQHHEHLAKSLWCWMDEGCLLGVWVSFSFQRCDFSDISYGFTRTIKERLYKHHKSITPVQIEILS